MTPDPAAYPPGSSWRIVTSSPGGEAVSYCLACQAHDTLARLREAGDELVTCWCLYKWIAGNNAAESRKKIIPRGNKKRLRPEDATSNEYQAWRHHLKRGGTLSFQSFQAKTKERQNRGQGFRSDLLCAPLNEGASRTLKRSPAEIIAKFARMGYAPKPKP